MMPTRLRQTIGRSLLRAQWIFAKTMPENPHWYTLRKTWAQDAAFVETVEAMRTYGYREWYKKRPYTMFNVNGMKYWTMGAPLPSTILINRKPIDYRLQPYDPIAPVYDAAFADPASTTENQQLLDLLGDLSQLSVLDVGCGTGFLLDHTTPAHYTGLDPSAGMLTELRRKHPTYSEAVICCPLEEFVGDSYDCVLALFGTPNYIAAETLLSIPLLLAPGGRYVLMFFAPDYIPLTYLRTGYTVAHTPGMHVTLPGNSSRLGNFLIVEGRV